MQLPIETTSIDFALMKKAFIEASNCKVAEGAFSVGAILATMDRVVLATGYSRELGEHWHAEEVAIKKAGHDLTLLNNCILYCTLEPCGDRRSRPTSCSQLILNNNIPVVFFATKEPTSFIDAPRGIGILTANGVQVQQLDGFDDRFNEQNGHIV